jgi:hypothetical protein
MNQIKTLKIVLDDTVQAVFDRALSLLKILPTLP